MLSRPPLHYLHHRYYNTGMAKTSQLLNASVSPRLPAQDLARARKFYAEKLGFEPFEERPGGLKYQCRDGTFVLFESSGASDGSFTQMAFQVDDIEAAVAELQAHGLKFEEYDEPGLKTVNCIADVEGNYPSTNSSGERAAWFYDSEGNLLAIGQSAAASAK